MTNDDDALRIDGILCRKLLQKLIAGSYIFEATGPSASGISYSPIFEVPSNESGASESRANKTGVREIVAGAPETAVNKHNGRKGSRSRWQSQISEVILIGTITQAGVSGRWSVGEDVFAVLHGAGQAPRCFSQRLRLDSISVVIVAVVHSNHLLALATLRR